MEQRLTVRVLSTEGHLLGWADVLAAMPGDGTLRVTGRVPILIERAGQPFTISVHWVDANVEVRTGVRSILMAQGETLTVSWDQPIIVIGIPPVDLPMVTVRRPTVLMPPCGNLGAAPSYLDLSAGGV